MYEMEAEGKAGLTPQQKEAQLQIFYHYLQYIMNKWGRMKDIQLICYDGKTFYICHFDALSFPPSTDPPYMIVPYLIQQ